jgi:hypothetical protein
VAETETDSRTKTILKLNTKINIINSIDSSRVNMKDVRFWIFLIDKFLLLVLTCSVPNVLE